MSVICSGLGGGLDVVNASLFHFLALENQQRSLLGSSRSLRLADVHYDTANDAIDAQSCLVRANTLFETPTGRYAEALVARQLDEPVLYLTRNKPVNIGGLRDAIDACAAKFAAKCFVFCDGGGDSLVLQAGDTNSGSEVESPFDGGECVGGFVARMGAKLFLFSFIF